MLTDALCMLIEEDSPCQPTALLERRRAESAFLQTQCPARLFAQYLDAQKPQWE